MQLSLFEGSLLDLPGVDAIVVPANRQLTLGWGSHLAEAVLERAGRKVEEEALAWAAAHGAEAGRGIALGEAALSSGGRLAFRNLVHAAVLDKYDFNPLFLLRLRQRTSDATLVAAVHSSVARAREAGLGSLGFSLMGAGIGGMPAKKCARLLVQTLRAETGLERAVIAVLGRKDRQAVEEALSAA